MFLSSIKKIFRQPVQFYYNLKIIWKMIIGFGLILASVFLMTMINQMSIYKINSSLENLIEGDLEPMIYLNDIRSYVAEMEVMTRDAIVKNDELALKYIKNQYLPNTLKKTVEYSFNQLIDKANKQHQSSFRKRFHILRSQADRRMAQDTVTVFKELRGYWQDYASLYKQLMQNIALFQSEEFTNQINRARFNLIGGIDRLIETKYRQQGVVAQTEASEIFKQQQYFTWVLFAVTIFLALGTSFLTAMSIIIPLKQMAIASRKIAKGELTVNLSENRGDELGEVAHCFNIMASELNLLISEIQDSVHKVNENSKKLIDGSQMATTASQQLLATMTQVANGADVQQQKVVSIHRIIQAVTDFSGVVHHSTHQVANLSQESVSKAVEGEKSAQDVHLKIQRMKEFMKASQNTTNNLQIISMEIQGMVSTVRDIAEQTNLLSLNAAIEAARAGEAGRGFSVVAESIGDLAVRTKNATSQVTALVKRVQNSFTELSQMIAVENREILEGEIAVSGLGGIFETIIKAAKAVDDELQQVSSHTLRLAKEHHEVLMTVEQISEIANAHKEGTIQASSSVEQHFAYTQEIIGVSQILAQWGDTLRHSVKKFKIGA